MATPIDAYIEQLRLYGEQTIPGYNSSRKYNYIIVDGLNFVNSDPRKKNISNDEINQLIANIYPFQSENTIVLVVYKNQIYTDIQILDSMKNTNIFFVTTKNCNFNAFNTFNEFYRWILYKKYNTGFRFFRDRTKIVNYEPVFNGFDQLLQTNNDFNELVKTVDKTIIDYIFNTFGVKENDPYFLDLYDINIHTILSIDDIVIFKKIMSLLVNGNKVSVVSNDNYDQNRTSFMRSTSEVLECFGITKMKESQYPYFFFEKKLGLADATSYFDPFNRFQNQFIPDGTSFAPPTNEFTFNPGNDKYISSFKHDLFSLTPDFNTLDTLFDYFRQRQQFKHVRFERNPIGDMRIKEKSSFELSIFHDINDIYDEVSNLENYSNNDFIVINMNSTNHTAIEFDETRMTPDESKLITHDRSYFRCGEFDFTNGKQPQTGIVPYNFNSDKIKQPEYNGIIDLTSRIYRQLSGFNSDINFHDTNSDPNKSTQEREKKIKYIYDILRRTNPDKWIEREERERREREERERRERREREERERRERREREEKQKMDENFVLTVNPEPYRNITYMDQIKLEIFNRYKAMQFYGYATLLEMISDNKNIYDNINFTEEDPEIKTLRLQSIDEKKPNFYTLAYLFMKNPNKNGKYFDGLKTIKDYINDEEFKEFLMKEDLNANILSTEDLIINIVLASLNLAKPIEDGDTIKRRKNRINPLNKEKEIEWVDVAQDYIFTLDRIFKVFKKEYTTLSDNIKNKIIFLKSFILELRKSDNWKNYAKMIFLIDFNNVPTYASGDKSYNDLAFKFIISKLKELHIFKEELNGGYKKKYLKYKQKYLELKKTLNL